MKKYLSVLLVAIFVIVLPIDSSSAAGKNPYGTLEVDPAGPNEIIFTISKGSKKADFAYSRFLKMKSVEITINEPFIKKRQTFTAIPISRLFALVGISGKDSVITTALNDYIFTDSASNFLKANAYVAIKKGGQPIGYDEGGPIRIIYRDKSSWAKFLDSWNWSLRSIAVK